MTHNAETLFANWATAAARLHTANPTGDNITTALTAGTLLARAATANQWDHVHTALRLGVPGSALAQALDLPVAEVRSQFKGWCRAQRTLMRYTGRGMTNAEADEAVALMEQAATR